MAQSRRCFCLLAIGALSFAGPSLRTAQARPTERRAVGDPYDAARDAEARLDYKAVVTYASQALELPNTHERLVNLYRLLGTANGVLGKSDDAVDAFTKLLAIDPEHRLPRGTSPKITGPFKEAGGYWVDRPGGLQIAPTLPREMTGGQALSIAVKLDDPLQMAANVRLSYRLQGDPDFSKLETAVGPTVTFNLSAEQLPARKTDYVVELFFTALSSTGSELRGAGDAAHPSSIAIRAKGGSDTTVVTTTTTTPTGTVVVTTTQRPVKKPLVKQWWLWTAVGVVVVGVAVGASLGWYYTRPDGSHTDADITTKIGP